jgi:hypothetical protein
MELQVCWAFALIPSVLGIRSRPGTPLAALQLTRLSVCERYWVAVGRGCMHSHPVTRCCVSAGSCRVPRATFMSTGTCRSRTDSRC